MSNAPIKQSLYELFPRRLDVPIGIGLAALALSLGFSLPVMTVEKLVFWEDSYSLLSGSYNLFNKGYIALAAILFLFSIVFPTLKLLALTALWFLPTTKAVRSRCLRWLALLGKWSMLDVFVVALTIVLTASTAFASAVPQAGIYLFCAAIFLSMLVTGLMENLARRSRR